MRKSLPLFSGFSELLRETEESAASRLGGSWSLFSQAHLPFNRSSRRQVDKKQRRVLLFRDFATAAW